MPITPQQLIDWKQQQRPIVALTAGITRSPI